MNELLAQSHPLLVHFPIALLIVYGVAEIVRLPIFRRLNWWPHFKGTLVLLGTIGAYASIETGEKAGHALVEFVSNGPEWLYAALEKHEQFAEITLYIFGILAAAYLVRWLSAYNPLISFIEKISLGKLWRILSQISRFILKPLISVTLAIAGLITVSITGALGGIIAHGPIDPIAKLVASLLLPPM